MPFLAFDSSGSAYTYRKASFHPQSGKAHQPQDQGTRHFQDQTRRPMLFLAPCALTGEGTKATLGPATDIWQVIRRSMLFLAQHGLSRRDLYFISWSLSVESKLLHTLSIFIIVGTVSKPRGWTLFFKICSLAG